MSDLADAIAAIVGSLGDAHVERSRTRIASAGQFTTEQAATVTAGGAGAAPRPRSIGSTWPGPPQPELAGDAIALALESRPVAARRADVARRSRSSSPARTRPPRRSGSPRRSSASSSTRRNKAGDAGQLRRLPDALDHRRARRGRRPRRARSASSSSRAEKLDGGGGAHAYARFRTYHWPIDRREPPDAKLHAKAVIVDSRDVLLTSANMTNAAYDKNIELGVLCRGGGVAEPGPAPLRRPRSPAASLASAARRSVAGTKWA